MSDKYIPLEQYLRALPASQEEVKLTFEHIQHIINAQLPPSALGDPGWWNNQKQGTQVEALAWMDAGWLVETVSLTEQWVRFVRQ